MDRHDILEAVAQSVTLRNKARSGDISVVAIKADTRIVPNNGNGALCYFAGAFSK